MNIVLTSGILAISIDLDLDVQRRGGDQQGSLETIGRQLTDLLARYHLPATWAVADPAVSAATEPHPGQQPGSRNRHPRRPHLGWPRSRSSPFDASSPAVPPAAERRDWPFRRCCCAAPNWTIISTWPSNKGLPPSPAPRPAGRQMVWPQPGRGCPAAVRAVAIADPTRVALERDSRVLRSPVRQAKTELAHAVSERQVFHLSISGLAAAETNRSTFCAVERLLMSPRAGAKKACWWSTPSPQQPAAWPVARQTAPSRSILQPAA